MFCSMSGVGIKHSLKQLLCCSIMNVYKHQTYPKAPKLLFLCSIQWFLFKQKKKNCAPWTKPEHIFPSISQDLRRDTLLLLCSTRAVSHTSFLGTNSAIVWLLQQAACQQMQFTQERAAGKTSWSAGTAMDRISHHSVLTDWSWDLILYSGHMGGRAASALLLSALCQPGSYSFNKKKSCSWTFWGPHYLSRVGLHSFQIGMWDLLSCFL